MKITKFKLIKGGEEGIEIEAKEYLASGNYQIVDSVKRKRNLAIPKDTLREIRKLKYYYLNLTGHWISAYAQYFDNEKKELLPVTVDSSKAHLTAKELWNKTEVTGAAFSGPGFILTGKIETVDGKFCGIATPIITDQDDIGFYEECLDVLGAIESNIISYVTSKQILWSDQKETVSKSITEGKTEDEVIGLVADKFIERGFLVMMGDESYDSIESTTTLSLNTKNIDGGSVKESLDETAEEEEKVEEESTVDDEEFPKDPPRQKEKVNPFGPPASTIPADISGNVPREASGIVEKVDNLSELEHSSNMGLVEDIKEQEEEW